MADKHILVVIGPDPALAIDLTAFDAVRDNTGVEYTALLQPTLHDFLDTLTRIRVQYESPPYIHIAAHMNPGGITFADGEVNPGQLSGHLSGVEVLFLAGCESTNMGDFLGGVPYVLTMMEKVDNLAARYFAEIFWLGVASNQGAPASYLYARKKFPALSPYTYLHNHNFLAQMGAG